MCCEKVVKEKVESGRDGIPCWQVWRKRRYIVAILGFWGFFNAYALRVNLSIGIVAMTETKSSLGIDGNITYTKEFDWDSKLQGHVLSAFFYGYILSQFAGGWLSSKLGGKRLFGVGIAFTAFCTLLTPFFAKQSVYLLVAVRVIEGIFEGVTYPSIHAVWSRWAPPLERTLLANLAFSGCFAGNVVAMPLSAIIANSLGWESIFYIFGALGVVWFIIWWYMVSESPQKDRWISDSELQYIKESLGDVQCEQRIRHPWKSILTSAPVWAIIASHFSENWGFYTLLTLLPQFMKDVLKFDLKDAGFASALPYLAMSITVPISGCIADRIRSKRMLTTTQVRKLFNCGAFLAQTGFLLAATHVLSPINTIICLTFSLGIGGFAWAGFVVNYLDVGPQHASVIMGIGNTFATLPGILSPTIAGYIVTTQSVEEWRIVFYITSAVYLFGCVFYGIFSSGELQQWAIDAKNKKENNLQKNDISKLSCNIDQ